MNNEIILQLVKQKKPKCYNFFEENIITELNKKVEEKKYEFTKLDASDKLDALELNNLFFDIIKILWQKSKTQRQYIRIIFLLLCEEDNFNNIKEQKGGIGEIGFIYSIIFALLLLMNTINANQIYKRGPPRRPKITLGNPIVVIPNETQNSFSVQPRQLYTEEMFTMEFAKIKDFLFIVNNAKNGLKYFRAYNKNHQNSF